MALKFDMSKVYDIIKWDFVLGSLEAFEFPTPMLQLIKICISYVSYRLLINGQPNKCFYLERGVRQGDPLSPYLFIICVNVLSSMLKKEELSKGIHYVQVARKAPTTSHLVFTDDSMLFVRANAEEADRIKQVLSSYQIASRQVVNIAKFKVSFNGNVGEESKEMIRNRLGFIVVIRHSKYLGLPVVFGRSKKTVFKLVID